MIKNSDSEISAGDFVLPKIRLVSYKPEQCRDLAEKHLTRKWTLWDFMAAGESEDARLRPVLDNLTAEKLFAITPKCLWYIIARELEFSVEVAVRCEIDDLEKDEWERRGGNKEEHRCVIELG